MTISLTEKYLLEYQYRKALFMKHVEALSALQQSDSLVSFILWSDVLLALPAYFEVFQLLLLHYKLIQ